jgi:hypothetical protein
MSPRGGWGGCGLSTPKWTDCQLHSDSELDIIFKPALSSVWTHQSDGLQCSESLLYTVRSQVARAGTV